MLAQDDKVSLFVFNSGINIDWGVISGQSDISAEVFACHGTRVRNHLKWTDSVIIFKCFAAGTATPLVLRGRWKSRSWHTCTGAQSPYKSSHPDNRQIEIWKWGHPGWRAEARPSGVGRPRPCHDHGDHQGPRLLKVHERSSTGWRKIIQWLGCDFLNSTTRWQHEVVVRCSSVRKETSRPSDSTPTTVSPSPILSTAFRLVSYRHWFWQIGSLQH